jgi:hypothetical protein
MTEKQIKEYEKLSKLKEQYENFIARDGDVSIIYYSYFFHDSLYAKVDDDEFKDLVKTLAKERLEIINKQIEEL